MDFLKKIFDNRRVLRDFDGCGKRYEREVQERTISKELQEDWDKAGISYAKTVYLPEPTYAECMWDCKEIHEIWNLNRLDGILHITLSHM